MSEIAKKVNNKVTRKSGRQGESHGSTTITVSVKVPATTLVIPARSQSSPAMSKSPNNLSIFKEIPGLPNRAVTPVEEILGLARLILIIPDPPWISAMWYYPLQVPLSFVG
jgi:hypothetical protein